MLCVHWPDGNLGELTDIGGLVAHIDLLPTLLDPCGLARCSGPTGQSVDGASSGEADRANPSACCSLRFMAMSESPDRKIGGWDPL